MSLPVAVVAAPTLITFGRFTSGHWRRRRCFAAVVVHGPTAATDGIVVEAIGLDVNAG